MKPFLIAALLAMIAGQAHALSCRRPDPIDTFKQVAAAPESYFVLYGELTFDGPVPASPATIPAQFRGKGLTREGFTSDYVSPVNLQIECVASWCGSARSGGDALYFVQATEPPVTMVAGACGGMIFPDPSQAVLDMLTSCMQGGACSAQPLE
ncbi:hypothetical protein [Yoonia sp. BS5-3]|uniref:Uncharacterized protein n=1 Tax=Yoonia phaeophyticola TaxID=3137369 RepID=A0ABZ2V7Y4_9RHOB